MDDGRPRNCYDRLWLVCVCALFAVYCLCPLYDSDACLSLFQRILQSKLHAVLRKYLMYYCFFYPNHVTLQITYQATGDDQGINFSELDSMNLYIPQVRFCVRCRYGIKDFALSWASPTCTSPISTRITARWRVPCFRTRCWLVV